MKVKFIFAEFLLQKIGNEKVYFFIKSIEFQPTTELICVWQGKMTAVLYYKCHHLLQELILYYY